MLQIKDLTVSMKKDLRGILKDFTFSLNSGDKAAVIGEEGNGKSTLLKLIYDERLVESYAEHSGAIQKDGMILAYLSPVSYTHLDVYKRQENLCWTSLII